MSNGITQRGRSSVRFCLFFTLMTFLSVLNKSKCICLQMIVLCICPVIIGASYIIECNEILILLLNGLEWKYNLRLNLGKTNAMIFGSHHTLSTLKVPTPFRIIIKVLNM